MFWRRSFASGVQAQALRAWQAWRAAAERLETGSKAPLAAIEEVAARAPKAAAEVLLLAILLDLERQAGRVVQEADLFGLGAWPEVAPTALGLAGGAESLAQALGSVESGGRSRLLLRARREAARAERKIQEQLSSAAALEGPDGFKRRAVLGALSEAADLVERAADVVAEMAIHA